MGVVLTNNVAGFGAHRVAFPGAFASLAKNALVGDPTPAEGHLGPTRVGGAAGEVGDRSGLSPAPEMGTGGPPSEGVHTRAG